MNDLQAALGVAVIIAAFLGLLYGLGSLFLWFFGSLLDLILTFIKAF